MQKLNKIASILLWSIFLSLIIGTLFIGISLKINKYIKENKKIEENIKNDNKKQNYLKKDNPKNILEISKNETLIINDNKNFKFSLKKDEFAKLKINKDTNLEINLSPGNIVNFSTGAEKIFLDQNKIFSTNSGETITIKNLGGVAKIKIFSEKNIILPYRKYKIIKKIGNKIIEKENGIIE